MKKENAEKVMIVYRNKIPKHHVDSFRNYLACANDECINNLLRLPMKSTFLTLMLSIFLGSLGLDRFYLGHYGFGTAKIANTFICVVLGWVFLINGHIPPSFVMFISSSVLHIVDIFYSYRIAREYNYDTLCMFLRHNEEINPADQNFSVRG